ncbi:MAG: hypothetical protein ACKVWR_13320 [Acidimicrobiales bacterium]
MANTNSIAHVLHDTGLAAWFGGSLMGAIGLNGAAASASDMKERTPIADVGWARWTPVNFVGIGAHLLGGALLVAGNKGRLVGQQGVASTSGMKTALTAAALAATGWARLVGRQIQDAGPVMAAGPTDPTDDTPDDVARAMRKQKVLQWVIPATTGALVVLSAYMSEQQRSTKVMEGTIKRLMPGGGDHAGGQGTIGRLIEAVS